MRNTEFFFRFLECRDLDRELDRKRKEVLFHKLYSFREVQQQMDIIVQNRVRSDLRRMNRRMVEVFDQRQSELEKNPPMRSLGRMPLDLAMIKFR